jgi:hypothetical protein
MPKVKKLFVSCTMRSGNSLLVNLLSSNKNYLLLNERLHFFRFIYNFYSPLNKKKINQILFDLNLRLKYRHDFEIDTKQIKNLIKDNLNYKKIYLVLMKYFSKLGNKKYWGESSPMNWRNIPNFLKMHNDGCAIHLIRDPRAMFSSWKKLSSIPNYAYLNCIFNWLDSANHIQKYKETYSTSKYMILKYEELTNDPEKYTKKICKFINLNYYKRMLNKSNWTNNNHKLVSIPRSAHDGNNILGFSKKRINNWKKELEEWEILLIEHVLYDQMKSFGYKPLYPRKKTKKLNNTILNKIKKNKLIRKNYNQFILNGSGTPFYPMNPRDYRSWGASKNASEWFVKTKDGKNFIKERNLYYNKNNLAI